MPFLRDWTSNQTSLTTGTTIVGSLPSYQQNDLLLAILTADTYDATGGFSNALNSGWTQLFAVTNTVYMAVLYKIAGASESNPTFTSSDSETYNLHLLAIGDVNTTTPFNGTGGAGTGYRTANNSAARVAMPVLTTTVDNSLIIYVNSESAAVVPGVLEGACIWEDAMDGSAHSDGFSWGFKATAGATPSTVYGNKSGTAAGIVATIGISPPSGGATVIPNYCAGDASIYVDPIHGVTAYNGGTAFAATATTHFGTSLNGVTLNNGTAAAAADVGLNSYHSMGQCTGGTTANQWYGCTIIPASAAAMDGKNVLCHVMPSNPKIYQTTDPVNDTGAGKGIAFGMATTSNTNYRWWHVHGAGSLWDSAQHVPIVINSGNTSGRIQNTGTFGTSASHFGFAVSGFTTAPVFRFGSLWVLDTTTVCGGNATYPVKVPGIVKACANGKERMSILQSGAAQMLSLQPIQLGNGGTDPIYLDLDGTAIEFPQQYSVTDRQVFYCSADNVAGLKYYAGASDTIKHRNSVVSSKSRFHWGLHASSNTSATYDFSGLSVIGAGTITLNRAITITGLTINDYSTIDASDADFVSCSIKKPPATSASITLTSSSSFTDCTIDVSTVTSGNYWATIGDPTIFSGCNFTGGGGHAIRITTPGTYSFVGNVFTSFGADGSNGAAIYNDSGGAVTLNISGGGTTPTYRNGTSATTTVNNSKTLQLTGLVTGSDIVILTSGSTTVRQSADQNVPTTYDYSYSYVASDYVDICVYKAGYIPWQTRSFLLANSDASLPVSQVPDPSYVE